MKTTIYLIVAMLMAFTMVGCQVDLSDYLTKEEADAKYATIAYVDGKVADLETKINNIDAKFADYYTKGEVDEKLKGYATKESLEALSDISKAVKDYLETVDWNGYIEDGYTNDKIDEKINAIKEVTDKLGNVETLLADVSNLKTKVGSLETKDLSESQLESIKTTIKSEISGDITTIKNEILADAVTVDGLSQYIKDVFGFTDSDIEVMIDWNKYNSMDYFTFRIAELGDRISIVENLLTVDGVLGKKLTDLATTVNSKADASGLTSLKETYESFIGTYENLESALESIDLSAYLTSDALSGYAKTEDIPTIPTDYYTKSEVDEMVETVASSLAKLTSRVEILEDVLEIENDTSIVINELIFAVKGVNGDKDLVAELNKALNELKETVENNSNKLTRLIGDDYTDTKTITERVAEIEYLLNGYADFKKTTNESLAKISSIEETLKNKADSFNKDDIVNLIKDSFIEKVENVTYATTKQLDELTTKVNSKADTTEMNNAKEYIENITSRLEILESDKTKVELCPNCFADDGDGTYVYYPYIKFTDNNGKVSYMTFFDYGYNEDDPVCIGSSEGNLDFNGTIKEGRKFNHYAINFVNEIPSGYLPKINN